MPVTGCTVRLHFVRLCYGFRGIRPIRFENESDGRFDSRFDSNEKNDSQVPILLSAFVMAANLANEGIILHRIDFLNANPDCLVNIWDVLIEQCITAWLTVVGKQNNTVVRSTHAI